MKAEETMKKYGITRPTLCKWLKEGKINAVKLPNGQYDYEPIELEPTSVDVTQNVDNSLIDEKLALLAKMAELELKFFKFLRSINFMGPEFLREMNDLMQEYRALTKNEQAK